MSRPVCAIVGAGEGLGAALAAKFASEGCDIAALSRSEAGTGAARDAALAADSQARSSFFYADATQPETVEQAFAEIERSFGVVDILIYNPRGTFLSCAPLDMGYEALEEVFRLEVIGAFAAAKSVLPGMCQRGKGTLLFSSATAALRGSASYPLYAIGKFGLRGLSQSLAKAYSAEGVHIAHVRLDCDLDVPVMRDLYGDRYDPELLASPEAVAKTYWWVHQQPKNAWSNEVEIRPHTETWTC